MNRISIGADPEVFLERDNKIITAIGLVPGSKHQPHPTQHGWIQPDNMLAEFNIKPCTSRAEFIKNLSAVMQDLREYGQLRVQASHEFSMEELQQAGEEAFVFGCEPDYNAWMGGIPNPRPDAGGIGLRTAGGHIHIGCPEAQQHPLDVVLACDVTLGLGSLFLDDDTRRRALYGKAGAYRLKPYGVEYRTLSNFWIRSPDLMAWAYTQTVRAVKEMRPASDFALDNAALIQQAINYSDKALATELLAEYEIRRAA